MLLNYLLYNEPQCIFWAKNKQVSNYCPIIFLSLLFFVKSNGLISKYNIHNKMVDVKWDKRLDEMSPTPTCFPTREENVENKFVAIHI